LKLIRIIIKTDEGAILLKQLRKKQINGDAEMQLLCKIWGGQGDHRLLSAGKLWLKLKNYNIKNVIYVFMVET
jgi:hypothetical protein